MPRPRTKPRIQARSWVGRSWLVSITVETSRSRSSSSRSSSMASTRAPRSASGWVRRVSEKRRTRAGVVASRKTVRMSDAFGLQLLQAAAPGAAARQRCEHRRRWRCGGLAAAARGRRKSRSSSGGRLSTQKKPASSSACKATDLPLPEMPVTTTTSRRPAGSLIVPPCAPSEGLWLRRPKPASPARAPGWSTTASRHRASARSRPPWLRPPRRRHRSASYPATERLLTTRW